MKRNSGIPLCHARVARSTLLLSTALLVAPMLHAQAATQSAATPQGSASPLAPNADAANPHGTNPHGTKPGAADGQEPGDEATPAMEMPRVPDALLRSSPFLSMQHRQWADQARAGRFRYPGPADESLPGIPAGTIGVLVFDAPSNRALGNFPVKLKVIHESIAEGNDTQFLDAVTDGEGRAAFLQRATDSAYRYEAQLEYQGAKYSSGIFQIKRDAGHVVALHVYPATQNLNDTFVFSRALYVVVPRDDVFECQVILRFHNASPITWLVSGVNLPLPAGSKGFRANEEPNSLEAHITDNVVSLSGSVAPGQKEASFTFRIPNPRLSSAHFDFPAPPNLVDGRVYTEVSSTASLSVLGFDAAQDTKGKEGQRALLASKDFLSSANGAAQSISATISGLPTRGYGSWVAAILAASIAGLGLSFAVTAKKGPGANVQDRSKARLFLLDELVALEHARKADEIGPKTYEQARRILVDSLARLDDSAHSA